MGYHLDDDSGHAVYIKLIAEYLGTPYDLTYDFGDNYSVAGAWFMFHEGNYSCDCNLSIFLDRYGGHFFPGLNCGERIKYRRFDIYCDGQCVYTNMDY